MTALRPSLLLAVLAVVGCSDDGKVDPSAVFGSGGSGGSGSGSAFCTEYCRSLVQGAQGCEQYNDNLRCEEICKFYVASACRTTYEAFADCLRNTASAECFVPDGGKLTLLVTGCHEQYETWIQCRDEKDAGICPY